MAVSQCVCHRISFADMKSLVDQTGMGVVELHQTTQCGSRCGLCIPYIRYMLQTGDTDPPVMWSGQFRELGIKCTSIERLENKLIAQGKLDASQINAQTMIRAQMPDAQA